MICYGLNETMSAIVEKNAVKQILVSEQLEAVRVLLRNKQSGKECIKFLGRKEIEDQKTFIDDETKEDLEIIETQTLVEWLSENYETYGAQLTFITNESPEGFQFFKGFGGIGGFLHYKAASNTIEDDIYVDDDEDGFM